MKGCAWFLLTTVLAVQTVFFTLKLMGTIDWSWWLVMLPLLVLYQVASILSIIILLAAYIVIQSEKENKGKEK